MSQDQAIILALKIVLIAGMVSVALFVAVYGYLADWRRNPIGRTVVWLDILLALALAPSTLSLFFHFNRLTSHVAAWTDIGIFALIAAGMLQRIPLWVKLHTDKAEHQSYAGMMPFLAQVIRRRGRPVWKDWPAAEAAETETAVPPAPEQEGAP